MGGVYISSLISTSKLVISLTTPTWFWKGSNQNKKKKNIIDQFSYKIEKNMKH